DSVLAPETWTRANSPHRVNAHIHIEGSGVLTLEPGALLCFVAASGLFADNGGRLAANGLDTARIVLTAADTGDPWWGVHLSGTPGSASVLKHVRIEHSIAALGTYDYHAATVDSATFRQNGVGLYLWGRGTHISRSRVDTTLTSGYPAAEIGTQVTYEQNVIRGSADVGLFVAGVHGVSLLGGRIEGSAGVGLKVTTTGAGFVSTQPVRVVGGAGYPAEMVVSAFPRIYTAIASQDSLLGNGRDTLVVTGGILQQFAYPSQALPWRVTDTITVQNIGILAPKPGATLVFDSAISVLAQNGGRVVARGTLAAPVLFTGADWYGIELSGVPTLPSYLTNVRIEHVASMAVWARNDHSVIVDSSVIRQTGVALWVFSSGSRISRTRVDTTTAPAGAAVVLLGASVLESTLIRGSGERGLIIASSITIVRDCEIRDSVGPGIEVWETGEVHNCNLVNNGGAGVSAFHPATANAEDNWWGDAGGPTGTNGDGVSGLVDYTPWRTTPVVLPYVP
ncbi:MAG TPA: right-handed parallel beta-helix repeat-containing protein, partial [Longimicrobium sp.]|nr:right-handed parallel beta-helix repeat-containing protein [Longimicrobium sp.]